jgi:hypothetical protein
VPGFTGKYRRSFRHAGERGPRQHRGIISRHFLPDSCRHADFPVLIARCPPGLLRVCLRFVQDTKLNVDALFKSSLA